MHTRHHKFKFLYFFQTLVVAAIILLCVPTARAATLTLVPSTSTVALGNIFSVRVLTNTTGDAINNVEATIQFPTDLLEVVSVSKASSIFTLWVEEPSFSNSTGRIVFNGGAANPGFNGSNGMIASVTFRAKKVGTASIIFADGAVRKNDGMGTDVLTSRNSTVVNIGAPKAVEVPAPTPAPSEVANTGVPARPTIISQSHPDQSAWYPVDTATFSWKVPSGVTSVQAILNKSATGAPTITYDPSVTQKTLTDLSDGAYYFHLRYKNAGGWSETAHYKVNIDTTAPLAFDPFVREKEAHNILTIDATDAMSGIGQYSIGIDGMEEFKLDPAELRNGGDVLPELALGAHEVHVRAFDKAGNYTDANTRFYNAIPPRETTPVIAEPASYLENSLAVQVTFALFWLIMLIALFTILLFILYYGWHKFFSLKAKLNKELEITRDEAHKAMVLFKEELSDQLVELEKIKEDRVLNKKEEKIFQGLQKNVDDIDAFLEKKLKKMM